MAKFVLLLLVCAFVVLCNAEEVKNGKNIGDDLKANFDANLKKAIDFINQNMNPEMLKKTFDDAVKGSNKLFSDWKADLEKAKPKE